MAFLTLNQMKSIGRYFAAAAATLVLASSCKDIWNPEEIIKANPGDEVVFGVALPGGTKTVYGDETADEKFPIYWVNGDLVKVASPQCMSGRNSAEYKVAVESEKQNYATSLTKTGEVGIQWGDAEYADFYSIYPSTGASLSISSTDVTASLSIANTQTATPKTTDSKDLVYEPADMKNVVMLAKTKDVSANPVELHYVPFSTVIEFAIPGPTNAGEMGASDVIIVQTLTLTAPEGTNIAGDFDFSLGGLGNTAITGSTANLSATNVRNASNSIILHLLDQNSAYATVHAGETLKVKMCLIPQPYTSLEGWKVTVKTNDGNYVKTIKSSELNSDSEKNKLKSGYVHKVNLPALNYKGEWNPYLANWIPELPDYTNIYLSEISLPGAWYAGSNEEYQATPDIPTLWNAGVRAFAVECRSWSQYAWGDPSRICVSGSGRNGTTGNGYVDPIGGSAKKISEIISSIAGAIKDNEYGVLVLSYADGGEAGHRDSDHSYFLAGIANEITRSGATNIYEGPITAETTVKDVLGKLIIKVNVDNQIPKGNYTGMNALISYNPFLSQMTSAEYTRPYYSNLYWSGWADSYKSYDLVANLQAGTGNENRFVWVFSSANRTHVDKAEGSTEKYDIPTYSERQSALGAMMGYSKQIYDASTHNVWFYFNCGGTEATSQTIDKPSPSPTAFATKMNEWLLDIINGKKDASPLGIVMFNQCTNATYKGPEIVDAIVKMNAKFYLKHAGTSGSGTGGTQTNEAMNDAIVANGGEAI